MDLFISNGRMLSGDRLMTTNIDISGGIIHDIGSEIRPRPGSEVISAEGCWVIPGGIDAHVHLDLPTPAGPSSDNFETGSVAALAGGTTSFIDFVTPERNESLIFALHERKQQVKKCYCDYSFHMSITCWNENSEKEIIRCIESGITSFKVYLAYIDTIGISFADLEKLMKLAAGHGAMVTVHCEDGAAVKKNQAALTSSGKTGPAYHAASRPPEVEASAVEKTLQLAASTGCITYIVHVSAAASLDHIRKFKNEGHRIFAETCPQYVMFDDLVYSRAPGEAIKYVISPPIRPPADRKKMWQAMRDGTIDVFATDHCPFNMNQKRAGADDFTKIPNGSGGIEHRLQLLYTYGVLKNNISPKHFVDLFSTNPAKIFGMYPSKGVTDKGSDADIVIWNPRPESTISVADQYQNCDINIYDGIPVSGKIDYVIRSGEIVFDKNGRHENLPPGKFLSRGLPSSPGQL